MVAQHAQYESSKVSVFLIDPNRFFLQGLHAALNQHTDIEIAGESGAETEAFPIIQARAPRVVLLGMSPPLFSGMDLTRSIAQHLAGTSVIMLTPHFNDDEAVQAATAGAAAYLSKDVDAAELAGFIRRAARGELLLVENLQARPPVLERILRHFRDFSLKGRVSNPTDGPITRREAEVLSYVACGYGNKQIANVLGISEQTIKNHMTAIMSRLDAHDRTHAAIMALQSGWISTRPTDQESGIRGQGSGASGQGLGARGQDSGFGIRECVGFSG